MDAKKEKDIVGGRIWMNDEIGQLVGFLHEQDGYNGIKYGIREMKRMAKVLKKDLKK